MAGNRRKRKQPNKTLNRPKIEEEEAAAEPETRGNKNITITDEEEEEAGASDEQWRDWASMTEPLLQSILSLLTNLQDFSAFRSVCKIWRSIAIPNQENLSHQSPLLLLLRHSGRPRTKRNKSFFDFALSRRYASPLPFGLRTSHVIGYSHGCIIAIPSTPCRRILLCHVITGKITRLPSTDYHPYRILLSAPPSSPTCIALFLGIGPRFLHCRVGDHHWTEFCFSRHAVEDFQDVVFVRERIHLLTPYGNLCVIDFAPRQEITFLEASKIGISADDVRMMFLAESGGDLLLVNVGDGVDTFYDQSNFEGYKIWRWDFEGGRGLVEVTSLGERALFISYDGVTSISASAGSGVRGNCIYQIQYYIHRSSYGCTVYSLDDRTLISVVLPESLGFSMDDVLMPPVWIFPSLC